MSFLDEEGRPTVVDIATIIPPSSKMGTVDSHLIENAIKTDKLYKKYSQIIDRQSAYEILKEKIKTDEENLRKEEIQKQQIKENAKSQKTQSKKSGDTILEAGMKQITRSMTSSFGRQIGKELFRGLFGSLTKKR